MKTAVMPTYSERNTPLGPHRLIEGIPGASGIANTRITRNEVSFVRDNIQSASMLK